MAKKTYLIAGLGNPGTKYNNTRHNIGFMVLDYIAEKNNADKWKSAFNADTSSFILPNGDKAILLKPKTFMNLSGESVQAAIKFYKLEPENLIVVHDELDIPTGEVKIKQGGGSAGHNGIKSIDKLVGNNFHRVRIGINHPRELGLEMDVSDWVLGKFSSPELKAIKPAIENANDAIFDLIS